MADAINRLLESWTIRDSTIHPLSELREWIDHLNATVRADITPAPLESQSHWYFDEERGEITNRNRSFFSITGMRTIDQDRVTEQPVILQDEIGYLGIICRDFDGVTHLLMQAKIEPGNVNVVQISPTIQATRSNFTRQHGGASPAYLDYFVGAENHTIVVDQIQSEQSSRFLGKRNRNIVIDVEEEVPESEWHRWMTLGQLKELLKVPNLVNMDTRTVLSCLPFFQARDVDPEMFTDQALYRSMFEGEPVDFPAMFHRYNDAKMFSYAHRELVPLSELSEWHWTDAGFERKDGTGDFRVIFCDIHIVGRERPDWFQPLFAANGIAEFGLATAVFDGVRRFLVRLTPEPGSFDYVEYGPTLQREPTEPLEELDGVARRFVELTESGGRVLADVLLSEEGGRFYHEENRNIILDVDPEAFGELPRDYVWCDFRTLNTLVQFNNVLNIQLRNLMTLLEI